MKPRGDRLIKIILSSSPRVGSESEKTVMWHTISVPLMLVLFPKKDIRI